MSNVRINSTTWHSSTLRSPHTHTHTQDRRFCFVIFGATLLSVFAGLRLMYLSNVLAVIEIHSVFAFIFGIRMQMDS